MIVYPFFVDKMKQIIHYIFIGVVLLCVACSKDDRFTTDRGSVLTFSTDSILFDTVFSTIGSSTKRFMVYNTGGDNLRIKNVAFRSGGTNGFRLNLDGQFGTSFTDVELLAGDSLFCFVEVTVNPQDKDNPVLIDDQIVFTLESGIQQPVNLQAYGQDVIILKNHKITADETFTANRPYLIYNTLTIDSLATLTLSPGASLYFHANGSIDCYGTIHADGEQAPITFRGDRLDRIFAYLPYDRLDNQWLGITLNLQSHDNYFRNVDIHSGTWGIAAIDTTTTKSKLEMHRCTVHNVGGNGLQLTFCKSLITNTQISNCRGECVTVTGGNHQFLFCTIAQFCPWIAERGKGLYFTNIKQNVNNGQAEYMPLEAFDLTNCLVTGYADDEVTGAPWTGMENVTPVFNFHFTNCLLKTSNWQGYESFFTDCAYQDSSLEPTALFRTIDTENFIYDFRLTESSPARSKGTSADGILTTYPTDRLGTPRPEGSIDAGCYQFQ